MKCLHKKGFKENTKFILSSCCIYIFKVRGHRKWLCIWTEGMGIMMKSLKPRINRQFQTRLLKIKTVSLISKTQLERYQTRTKLKVSDSSLFFCGTRSILAKSDNVQASRRKQPKSEVLHKKERTGQQHLLDT